MMRNFTKIEGFLDAVEVIEAREVILRNIKNKKYMLFFDIEHQKYSSGVGGSNCYDFFNIFKKLHKNKKHIVEKTVDMDLRETYNFSRVYTKGSYLIQHTDKKGCEVSVTISLTDVIWPLHIRENMHHHEIELRAGDALIYDGISCPHWRGELKHENHSQIFMHYIDDRRYSTDRKFYDLSFQDIPSDKIEDQLEYAIQRYPEREPILSWDNWNNVEELI